MKTFNDLKKLKDFYTKAHRKEFRTKDDEYIYNTATRVFGKKLFLKNITEVLGRKDIILVPNLFPYTRITDAVKGVRHYCLWSKKGKLTDDEIVKTIKKKFPRNDYMYLESTRKSIPEIMHYHVFIKL